MHLSLRPELLWIGFLLWFLPGGLLARDIEVPANRSFTPTPFFLQKGDRIRITATGRWRMGTVPGYKTWVGLAGNTGWVPHPNDRPNGCLVAKVGERRYYPAGEKIEFTAEDSGLLLLGPNDGGVADNEGSLRVQVAGGRPGSYLDAQAGGFARDLAAALRRPDDDQIALAGEHTGFVLKVGDLKRISDPAGFLRWFDRMYEHQEDLAGRRPYDGARVFYVSVAKFANPGWYMLAGNPVQYRYDATEDLVKLPADGSGAWGFVHEMGHNFSRVHGDYMEDGWIESTANIFTLYIWDKMRLRSHEHSENYMKYTARWWQGGRDPRKLKSDAWVSLGLFMTIQQDYGWDVYKKFFRAAAADETQKFEDWPARLDWWARLLSKAAGRDLSPRFASWGVPPSPQVRAELSRLKTDEKWRRWPAYFEGQ